MRVFRFWSLYFYNSSQNCFLKKAVILFLTSEPDEASIISETSRIGNDILLFLFKFFHDPINMPYKIAMKGDFITTCLSVCKSIRNGGNKTNTKEPMFN